MHGAAMTVMPATTTASAASSRKSSLAPERKYKCQFCNRAFSRSEHRSRHERSHTKERPFKCLKCRSTFVRRDLLLRHDRTVHAKDGGVPLHREVKRRAGTKTSPIPTPAKPAIAIDQATIEQIEASSDGMVDLETAAMLMTDLHHKATAAMSKHAHGGQTEGPDTPISPPGATLLEPSVRYPSGAISMSRIPWEFMPPTVLEPKAHSVSSAFSVSVDSQASFTSVGTVQPSQNQLAPIMQREFSNDMSTSSLRPMDQMQSLSGNAPAPPALSPYQYMTGPVSPVDYRRSPGPSQPLTWPKAPQVTSDEERNIILDKIRECDQERAIPEGFKLPGILSLDRYLSTYFNLFHHHLPFLHRASFKPTEVSSPLLLAVLSIGALYTFDQEQAFMLHIGSRVLVTQVLQNKESFSSRKCPLWMMQSSLLNMIFASWSGDPKGLEWSCSMKSLVANMVAGNRYELKLRTEAREGSQPTHEEWIEDEGCRRSYYAVYIFFGLLTMSFNHTPAISFNEFDSLELPSSESLWNLDASEEEAWRECLTSSTILTFREAHDRLFQGETACYSAFATRVMINALFLEVWYHKRSPEALQDVVTEYKLRLALETWQSSLAVCQPETVIVQLSAPHTGHPLIFNAKAMYRCTRARLQVDLRSIQEALRYHDPFEVAGSMSTAQEKVQRSSEMNKVIEECIECLSVAASQGIRWVARTSATNWSIEHPLCGMDLLIILTLWLYRLEHDDETATEEEISLYNRVRTVLDSDMAGMVNVSLSSVVARLWGSMLDEVVVWGITRLMGESFKLHSQALAGYDEDVASQASVPSMVSGVEESRY